MIDDTQNTTASDNSQFGPTRNPQNPGGQQLKAGGSDLQTPSNLVTNSDNLSISSVGNSDATQPASIQNTTQVPAQTQTETAKSPPYGIFALSALGLAIVLVMVWLMSRPKAA